MSSSFERAVVLVQHHRFAEAEEELRRTLAADPENPDLFGLLSQCLTEQKKHDEAIEAAQRAVGLGPDEPLGFYSLAYALTHADRDDEALEAIDEAIRLEPEDEAHYSLKANILYDQRRWREALEAAEQGLAIEPEDVACQNLRAMALRSLGRFDEAGATIDATLSRDPDSAISHANKGWTLLHQNKPKDAMGHFREALRLAPDLEYARQGILEALKARNFIYRQILKYFLFMSRMSTNVQWAIVIGAYVLFRVLRSVAEQTPEARPYVMPVLIAYIAFVFLSWTAQPLFNLMLRIHPFGKLALNDEEKMASNLSGLSLLSGIVCLVAGAILKNQSLLWVGLVFCVMVIPISGSFHVEAGRRRRMLFGYTGLLLVTGLAGAAFFMPLLLFFFIGVFLYTWVANALLAAG